MVCDNGTEFTSRAMLKWSQAHAVTLHFITPGKPTENAYIESFNGKLRLECLRQHWFTSLAEARSIVEDWRQDYNHVRPHRSLGQRTPAEVLRGKGHRLMTSHGLNLPVITVFGRTSIVSTRWDLSFFIPHLCDSSESDPIDSDCLEINPIVVTRVSLSQSHVHANRLVYVHSCPELGLTD